MGKFRLVESWLQDTHAPVLECSNEYSSNWHIRCIYLPSKDPGNLLWNS